MYTTFENYILTDEEVTRINGIYDLLDTMGEFDELKEEHDLATVKENVQMYVMHQWSLVEEEIREIEDYKRFE